MAHSAISAALRGDVMAETICVVMVQLHHLDEAIATNGAD
jgi:hypothetical protein